MSLGTKILLLFGVLAVLPMVLIGVADYYQSLYALGVVIDTKAQATSEAAARAILDRHAEAELALAELTSAPRVRQLLRAPGRADSAAWQHLLLSQLRAREPGAAGLFASLEVLDAGGRRVARVAGSGDPPGSAGACTGDAPDAALEWPIVGGDGRTVGRLRGVPRLGAFLPPSVLSGRFGAEGVNLLVDRRTGRILFSEPCDLVSRSAQAVLGLQPSQWSELVARGSGPFRAWRDHLEYAAGAAPVSRAGWVYLTLVPLREFTAPYARARSFWLLLVVLVGAMAALGFVILTRRSRLALHRLARAADAVGRGEFSPWLPPGGNDEVSRLSQAFGRMTARLQDLMRQAEFGRQVRIVGQMGAYVAHEIRNPLGAISIYLEGLVREVDRGRTPPQESKVLHLALDEIRRLEDTVTSFLALGQTQSGEPVESSLHRIAEQALLVLRGELSRRGLQADLAALSLDDTVVVDQAAIQGAIVNLVLNAADVSPKDGRIRLWTEAGRDPNGEPAVRLHIGDEGPGVAAGMRDRIFEPFFTTKATGSGIGLPVARQIAEEHGGRLVYQDGSGTVGGADFVLELPLAPISGERPRSRLHARAEAT